MGLEVQPVYSPNYIHWAKVKLGPTYYSEFNDIVMDSLRQIPDADAYNAVSSLVNQLYNILLGDAVAAAGYRDLQEFLHGKGRLDVPFVWMVPRSDNPSSIMILVDVMPPLDAPTFLVANKIASGLLPKM